MYNSTADRFRPSQGSSVPFEGVLTYMWMYIYKYELACKCTSNHHHTFNWLADLGKYCNSISCVFVPSSYSDGGRRGWEWIHPSLRCPSYEFFEKRVHLGNVTERRGNFTIALYDPAQGKKIGSSHCCCCPRHQLSRFRPIFQKEMRKVWCSTASY